MSENQENVKVVVRIRPMNQLEVQDRARISINKTSDNTLLLNNKENLLQYTFDAVMGENST
jgi:hypothetical protein